LKFVLARSKQEAKEEDAEHARHLVFHVEIEDNDACPSQWHGDGGQAAAARRPRTGRR
jgi:hypothetical protein